MNKLYRSLILLMMLNIVYSAAAWAEYSYGPVTFNAFGTLGGAWISNEHVDYTQGTQPLGPGISHTIDLGLDSRLGGQLSIALTPSTLITAQTVVERLPDNEFQPRLTQANIRQEIGEHIALRVGRIQSPVFLASDYRLANFSNPWVRTPGVLYNLYPLTHLDSAEFTYRHDTRWGIFSLNAGYGWLDYPFATMPNGVRGTSNVDMKDVVYANLKFDKGPWRVKLSWMHANTTVHVPDIDQLVQGVALMDPIAAAQLESVRKGGALYTVGFSYDSSSWLFMGEWGIGLADEGYVFNDKHGAYVTVGYHFDRWSPQITLGYQSSLARRVNSAIAEADTLIDYVHTLQRTDYRTIALGLNYSVTDSIILRGQVDVIEPMKNSWGPYFQGDAHYNFNNPGVDALFSLALDFVY